MTQFTALHSKKSEIIMAQDNNNLIWVDMEMTGLNPDADRIIEVASGGHRLATQY
jgi:oligoribonuclease